MTAGSGMAAVAVAMSVAAVVCYIYQSKRV